MKEKSKLWVQGRGKRSTNGLIIAKYNDNIPMVSLAIHVNNYLNTLYLRIVLRMSINSEELMISFTISNYSIVAAKSDGRSTFLNGHCKANN